MRSAVHLSQAVEPQLRGEADRQFVSKQESDVTS